MKIISWNVNGLRAILKKGDLQRLIEDYAPDVICLQETKAKQGQAEVDFAEYTEYWNSARRAGYSGTATFTKIPALRAQNNMSKQGREAVEALPIFAQDFMQEDSLEQTQPVTLDEFGDVLEEGRVLTTEFEDFYLVNVYVPNAKSDLERLKLREEVWDPMLLEYLQRLEEQKPIVCCGDFNVAHQEIDLARPQQNRGNAGFTDEERRGMDNYLKAGFVDIFRKVYPEKVQYSWWSYRARAREKGVGWRIDYFLISKALEARVKKVEILDVVMGSDHCPVLLELE